VAENSLQPQPSRLENSLPGIEAPAPSNIIYPLVSIVTPSFNQGRFLRRTIDSVLGQSYPKVEYVVFDGGSKDESVDVLRSYGDRFACNSEADGGQAHAINKGLARVNGEILAYLNSDDVLLPGAIARVVKFFRENPDCDMVYGDADYIDEDDRVTGIYRTAPYSFPRLMEDCMVCQPAAFWRRRIAEKVGSFNEQLNYAMDYDYWQRIDRAGGVIRFLPERLACSRRYPETKTLSARAAIHVEIFKVCKANTGDVHQNFFDGYWHHLFHERDALWSQVLRRVPGLEWRIAWLHHKWYIRDRITRRDVAMFLYEWVKVRVVAASRLIVRPFRTALRARPSGNFVAGYLTDNWLEPVLFIPPRRRAPGYRLHLAGIAPLDTVATVWAGDSRIGTFPLAADQYQEISFPADAVGNKSITIRFSNYFVDGAKRRLSFLLQDTNIFAEHDTQG
jgi:glycosyltransferase involved in cell wall biosynthesis